MIIKHTTSKSNTFEVNAGQNNIKVVWEDTLDNYSLSREKQIQKYFETKYKTTKVKVIFLPIKSKNMDVTVESDADASQIVLDEGYQKQLIEHYLKEHAPNVSIQHLMKLDSSVNLELENYKEQTNRYKTFKIESVEFSNFLSYGDDNFLDFSEKRGITSVISEPRNYGGKTTLTVDLLLFLFFGSTTKTDKLEDVFNKFTTNDYVEVRGNIIIENETYKIIRGVTRKKLEKGTHIKVTLISFKYCQEVALSS